jgi:hypothetical protein
MHAENQVEAMYDWLEQFLQRYNLEPELLNSLMKMQRAYYIRYEDRHNYPMNVKLDYNIWEFLSFNRDLVKRPSEYRMDFPEDKTMSFNRFLELFYFARRRNFGKATVDLVNTKLVSAQRGAGASKAQGSFSVKKVA